MNVKELITALQACEPTASVDIAFQDQDGPVTDLNDLCHTISLDNSDYHFVFLSIGFYHKDGAPSPHLEALRNARYA